jgi:hypothetical protein
MDRFISAIPATNPLIRTSKIDCRLFSDEPNLISFPHTHSLQTAMFFTGIFTLKTI